MDLLALTQLLTHLYVRKMGEIKIHPLLNLNDIINNGDQKWVYFDNNPISALSGSLWLRDVKGGRILPQKIAINS